MLTGGKTYRAFWRYSSDSSKVWLKVSRGCFSKIKMMMSQPWVRPIVRGKSKAPTEFVAAIENYKERFGYYPKRVLADKIYRSQANRNYCKERGIKISGPRLGRPGKNRPAEYLSNIS